MLFHQKEGVHKSHSTFLHLAISSWLGQAPGQPWHYSRWIHGHHSCSCIAFWLIWKKSSIKNTNKPVSAIRCQCCEGMWDALTEVAVKRDTSYDIKYIGYGILVLSLLFKNMWYPFCVVSTMPITVWKSLSFSTGHGSPQEKTTHSCLLLWIKCVLWAPKAGDASPVDLVFQLCKHPWYPYYPHTPNLNSIHQSGLQVPPLVMWRSPGRDGKAGRPEQRSPYLGRLEEWWGAVGWHWVYPWEGWRPPCQVGMESVIVIHLWCMRPHCPSCVLLCWVNFEG